MSESTKKKRRQVRVENPGAACGYVGHFTADELKDRAVGDAVDGTCPTCGMVHLSLDEIDELERQKVIGSSRFNDIKDEAEAKQD